MKYHIAYVFIHSPGETLRHGIRIVEVDHKMRESDIFRITDALKRDGGHGQLGITFFGLLEDEPVNEPQTGEIIPCTL